MAKNDGLEIDYKEPGGNKGQGAVARTNATNAAMYANAVNAQNYNFALGEWKADQVEGDIIRKIKTDQAAEQYKLLMQNREIQIDSQLNAFKRNSENVATQLELNRKAALAAESNAESVLKDRIKQQKYAQEELDLKFEGETAQRQFEFRDVARSIENAQENYFLNKASVDLEAGRTISGINFAKAQEINQFLENQAQQQDQRNNISRNYQQFASQSQFDFSMLEFDQNSLEENEKDGRKARLREEERTKARKEFEKQALDRGLSRFEASKEFDKMVAYKNFEDTRAQLMFQKQQRMFQETAQLGQALSRGQRGRSAARGMQSISALAGIDLAGMTDQINRAYDTYDMQATRTDAEVAEQRTETQAQKLRINQEIDEVRTETQAQIDASIGRSSRARQKTNRRKSRTQQVLDERQQQSLDEFNQSLGAETRALDRLNTSKSRYTDLKDEAQQNQKLLIAKGKRQRDQTVTEAEDRIEALQKAFGVSKRVFQMDRKQIGESMMSAMSAYESSVEDIWMKKYEADAKAYAARMFEPRFADAPKAPFQIPKFTTQKPTRPIEVPRGAVAPRPQAPQRSTASKILGIGGMILGAVAAPFTAGGSLAAGAAIAGVGAAATVGSAFV